MTRAEARELARALREWRGASARPWAYFASHATFQLELKKGGRRAFLWCVACDRLAFPRYWEDARIELLPSETSPGKHILHDRRASFLVECSNGRLDEVAQS